MKAQANIWTISAAQPFAERLVEGVLARYGADPLGLADCLILLPNRRAVRTVQTAFLRLLDAKATILPRLSVLGDDPEEGLDSDQFDAGGGLLATMEPMQRLMLLAQLIDRWQADKDPKPAATPAHLARLAASLARLLDQANTEGLSFDNLEQLVPEDLAVHWQDILQFLKIVTHHWPNILDDMRLVDASLARRQRLEGLETRWRDSPPTYPVIAAGSTGSIPATSALLKRIATFTQGHVILPPLDTGVDAPSWDALGESHPFGAMKRLLDRLEISRAHVRSWHSGCEDPAVAARLSAVTASMAPAQTFHQDTQLHKATALDGDISLIEASSGQEEATAAALLLRGALEVPGQTAALITPDRGLARRVAAILARWDIRIDDSAGLPLHQTPPARFVFLLAEALSTNMAPIPLLALMKHPFFRLGRSRTEVLAAARYLDKVVLRGVRKAGGLGTLKTLIDKTEVRQLLDDLSAATQALPSEPASVGPLITKLMTCAEVLSKGPDSVDFLAGDDGNALADWAARACQMEAGFHSVSLDMISALMEALMAGEVVRSTIPAHPRLGILGSIEARMVRPDVAVLGGLNDGIWPPAPQTDPWMNEPMRVAFGLPPHDRRIGLSALDFLQGCGARQVYLTRTTKKDGAPTLPSRWVSRLKAAYGDHIKTADDVLDWAKALNAPSSYKPWPQPRPTPPVSQRPNTLSVSDIERWLRDPYALYAKHILKLKPLDEVDQSPGAADKGSTIHDALEVFFGRHRAALPPDANQALMRVGQETFSKWLNQPGVYGLWWPRFGDLADWVLAEQETLFSRGRTIAGVELSGVIHGQSAGRAWSVKAKADRLDLSGEGLIILDYKTGAAPHKKLVEQGYAPQLAIEGLIARTGGFALPNTHVDQFEYWELKTTGGKPPKRISGFDARALMDEAAQGLDALFTAFADPKTAYLHAPAPEYAPYRDYDDLARPEEWRDVPEAQTARTSP